MSLEKLQDAIDEDLGWRKKEIKDIKCLLASNTCLERSAHVILCAHFEGFIKTVSALYIEYILSCKEKPIRLKSSLLALKYKNHFQNIKPPQQSSVGIDLIENIYKELNATEFIMSAPRKLIKTKGNPTPKELKSIIQSIGLQENPFELRDKFINEFLNDRHCIVHGEKYLKTLDFTSNSESVINMLEHFKFVIMEAARNGHYKRIL